MGARGPKPTPTAALEARGSWRAKTRDGEPEPERLSAAPQPPAGLPASARQVWDRCAPGMVGMGTLTADDLEAFERYCRAHAMWTGLADYVAGLQVFLPEHVKMLEGLDRQLRSLEARFGKTPGDRASIRVTSGNEGADPFAKPKLRAG